MNTYCQKHGPIDLKRPMCVCVAHCETESTCDIPETLLPRYMTRKCIDCGKDSCSISWGNGRAQCADCFLRDKL